MKEHIDILGYLVRTWGMNEISTSRMQHHADYSMKSAEGAGGLGLIRGNKNRRI